MTEINNGLQSRSASVADLGRNAEDIDKQQEADDAAHVPDRQQHSKYQS